MMPYNKECIGCYYWNSTAGACDYSEVEGVSRIKLHGGDYRELLDKPCQERKSRVERKGFGEAWQRFAKAKRRDK